MSKIMRILIADDHQLVREGLALLIGGFAGCEVVGSASNGREAVHLARELAPDVALLDINMPELNGIEACRQILRAPQTKVTQTRVILLSMHPDEAYVLRGIEAGAKGYVLKDAAPEELEQALRLTAQGGSFFSPEVTGTVMARLRGEAGETPASTLSAREREVLQLVCEGHSNRDIGMRLHISHKTVDSHRSQLMRKLGIHDVASLTRYALRAGLIA